MSSIILETEEKSNYSGSFGFVYITVKLGNVQLSREMQK